MLVYHDDELAPIGYTAFDFQSNVDLRKSTSKYVNIGWSSYKTREKSNFSKKGKMVISVENLEFF